MDYLISNIYFQTGNIMKNKIAALLLVSFVITGCSAPGGSVGDLAIGSDSAAIKAGRNRESAQLSRAELEQHRRQRTNVSEELALEREKRQDKRDQVNGAMGTAANAVGLIGGIAGTAALIKAWF
jgi:efflux transporter, RND family, MFP subunit